MYLKQIRDVVTFGTVLKAAHQVSRILSYPPPYLKNFNGSTEPYHAVTTKKQDEQNGSTTDDWSQKWRRVIWIILPWKTSKAAVLPWVGWKWIPFCCLLLAVHTYSTGSGETTKRNLNFATFTHRQLLRRGRDPGAMPVRWRSVKLKDSSLRWRVKLLGSCLCFVCLGIMLFVGIEEWRISFSAKLKKYN